MEIGTEFSPVDQSVTYSFFARVITILLSKLAIPEHLRGILWRIGRVCGACAVPDLKYDLLVERCRHHDQVELAELAEQGHCEHKLPDVDTSHHVNAAELQYHPSRRQLLSDLEQRHMAGTNA